jgi:hypothetical protein
MIRTTVPPQMRSNSACRRAHSWPFRLSVPTLIPILALLSNYDQENCLINVGTEGIAQLQYHKGRGQ